MKIIAILNQKGGVGKSTTAAALGARFTLNGSKVLFIDLDPQGNLSFALGADNSELTGRGALEILNKSLTAKDTIQHTAAGDIIASSPALSGADTTITATGKEYRLKEALQPLAGAYDYIIIDTPPALGILTVNALTAADSAIIPAQADIFSLQGITQLYNTLSAVKQYTNPALSVAGILLTRYNGRATISRDISDMLEQTAERLETRLFDTRIRECTALKEAQAMQKTIYEYAPKSNAAADYAAFTAETLEALKGV